MRAAMLFGFLTPTSSNYGCRPGAMSHAVSATLRKVGTIITQKPFWWPCCNSVFKRHRMLTSKHVLGNFIKNILKRNSENILFLSHRGTDYPQVIRPKFYARGPHDIIEQPRNAKDLLFKIINHVMFEWNGFLPSSCCRWWQHLHLMSSLANSVESERARLA